MHGETFQFIDVIVNFLNVTLPANYTENHPLLVQSLKYALFHIYTNTQLFMTLLHSP